MSVTVNTSEPRGLNLVKKLISKSDIIVENFAGGAMERMGLGYEVVCKALKPDIIMLSTSMQGQTGPYRTHPGSGHKLTALAGFNQILGWPDRAPGWIAAYTDFIAPRFNIIAIMAALEYRKRTGKGQYLDMSQYENGIQFQTPLVLDYAVNGRVPERMGNHCPYASPNNAYRCKGDDRWVAITASDDAEWEAMCGVVGKPEWKTDPRFSTLMARKENEDLLDSMINEWTKDRTAEDVMTLMQASGVAAGVVETGQDMMDFDPQFKARNTFIELEYPGIGKYRTPTGIHFKPSKFTCDMRVPSMMGADNEKIFKGLLGIPASEYDKLVAEKVID